MSDKNIKKKIATEQKYLNGLIKNLQNLLTSKELEFSNLKGDHTQKLINIDKNKTFSSNKEEEIEKINAELVVRGVDSFEESISKLKKQLDKPYFAKLSLQPKGSEKVRDIRIGKFSHNYDQGLIADWRAPVASLYYSNLQNNDKASYKVENEITGKSRVIDVNLKNRVKIDIQDYKIVRYYETSESLDVLTVNLEEKTGGQLDNIIETIQSEQDDIIRYNTNASLIVQGVAGSGKTTIAVHRMSYILYVNTDVNEHNTVFFVNSPILKRYLLSLVNDLGLSKKIVKNISEYLLLLYSSKRLLSQKHTYSDLQKINYKAKDYKNNHNYIDKLYKYLTKQEKKLSDDVASSSVFLYIKKGMYEDELADHAVVEKCAFVLPILYYLNGDSQKVTDAQSSYLKKTVEQLTQREESLLPMVIKRLEDILYGFNPVDIYAEFAKQRKAKFNILNQDDLIGIAIVAKHLAGEYIVPDKYKYIFIDEGQDFGLLFYSLIKELKIGDKVTILGDINQSVANKGAIKNWDEIRSVMDNNPKLFILPKSYRNTKQITEENIKLLEKLNTKYLPVAFDREGEPVIKNSFTTKKELIEKLVGQILKQRKKDSKSIVIIDNIDLNIFDVLKRELKKENYILENMKDVEDFESDGIYYGRSGEIKGLEFSTVILLTQDPEEMKDQNDIRQTYVNFSRAINNLFLFIQKK